MTPVGAKSRLLSPWSWLTRPCSISRVPKLRRVGGLTRRAAAFAPAQAEQFSRVIDNGGDFDAAVGVGQSAVLDRVGTKFVEHHGERQDSRRADLDIRGLNEEAAVAGACRTVRWPT